LRASGVFIAAGMLIVFIGLPPTASLKARTTTVAQTSTSGVTPPVVGPAVRLAVSVAPQPARQPALRIGVARPAGGYAVRTIPIDEYVAGVLAGEAARETAPSALEALAITVRTFAVANLSRHGADGFDLCDQTHCQVLRAATLATERAAAATSGKVLLYQGAPASVFYSASCGGRTERPSEVWPGAKDPEFLPSREDDACGGTPVWTAELSSSDLTRSLRAAGFTGNALRDVRILGRNTSGRVTQLGLAGLSPDHISGQDLRVVIGRTLGWQHIKSTAFDLSRTGAVYQFSGHGSGHGVGLCVIGSARLGARGQTAPQILARYFPRTAIAMMPAAVVAALEPAAAPPPVARPEAPRAGAAPRAPIAAAPRAASASPPPAAVPDVMIALPEGDEGEREVLLGVALQARSALARDLDVVNPPRVTLRLHPTVESYQRATGQPWYTAGATIDSEIHLVPLTVLRERGVLERTIRHEIVHLLTQTELAARPLWVREGTAIYFAGEGAAGEPARRADTGGKISCPVDRELREPASPGALSNAYARAAACVGRQIAAGRKWSEIR
jgi:SpoIID/LytB domain protein